MGEIKNKVNTYLVKYVCDDCEQKPNPGCVLIRLNICYPVNPPLYAYECPNCHKIYKMHGQYPSVEYEEINEF